MALLVGMTTGTLFLSAGPALAYGYHYDYLVANSNLSADTVFRYVNTHFRDVFSALLAPSDCPQTLTVGADCDLVGVDGKGNIHVDEVGSRNFVFRSRAGHIEGANKVINFTFYNEGDQVRLSVSATGEDNLWQSVPFANRFNRATVNHLWNSFADNVGGTIRSGRLAAPSQLNPAEIVDVGASLASPDGRYVLTMQGNGDLVLYAPGHRAVWLSHTTTPGTILMQQADGNLTLRAPGNVPVWASNTAEHPGTVLQIQNDGNVALYAPGHIAIWATNTLGA
ncbi:hypothetical protein [Frankia sp. AgKG'84/4]|nr:hypothetical protein [Frankia sp. AgKG'84/4]